MEKKKYNAPKVKIAVMEDLLNVGGGSGTVTEESKPNMVNEPESVQEPFSTSSDDNN